MTFSVSCPAHIVAALAPAIASEARPQCLRGINFEREGCAVATDGLIMTVARHKDTKVNTPGIYPISKSAVTKAKNAKAENVVIENGILRVEDASGSALHLEPCTAIDGTYPDWRRCIPNRAEEPCALALSGSILHALLDTATAAGKCRAEKARLTIRAGHPSKPHLVRYGHEDTPVDDVFSVVMLHPVQWGGETKVPFSI